LALPTSYGVAAYAEKNVKKGVEPRLVTLLQTLLGGVLPMTWKRRDHFRPVGFFLP